MRTMEFQLSDFEMETLQDDFMELYGYDFFGYARASFKRRLQRLFILGNWNDFDSFRSRLRTDPDYFQNAVTEISVNVTEMFRDPVFFKTLREQVIPVLATYPFIRIWHAGCATGEEVYSMAILLEEAGVLHKSILYATDINTRALERARKGVFSNVPLQQYSRNYRAAGGLGDFSAYYSANYSFVKFSEHFSKRMVFSPHNLVSDYSFNSFQLILCRNVLIYFDRDLQAKVFNLFDKSLEPLGFLALGTKESVRFAPIAPNYQQLENREKIWRKVR